MAQSPLSPTLTFFSTLAFRLPYNQRFMARRSRAFPLIQPRKLWPGNGESGDRLTKGHFRFAGKQVDMAASSWYPGEVDDDWLARLHAFNWLDDLRASSSNSARTTARALTLRWIEDHRRYRRKSWDPAVLATRLTQWMAHFDFLSSTADPSLQRSLLKSTMQQYRFLSRVTPGLSQGAVRTRALKALICVGYCLPGSGQTIARAKEALADTLGDLILPDGSMADRSSAVHMRLLLDLIDIRAALSLAGAQVPDWLTQALGKLAGFLRLLQHGDGRLANFQGEALLSARLISEALERADGGATPIAPSGGASGFYRLRAKRSLLLVDTGTARPDTPPPILGQGAHASALAFEFSVGQVRLVGNCGNFDLGTDWKQLQRATAAHSTLVWDDRNSSELLPDGGIGRQPSQIIVRASQSHDYDQLHLSHDGYASIGGGTHYRTLGLRSDGAVLAGEDRLEGAESGQPLVRFHLHPSVRAEMTMNRRGALLRLAARERGWRFDVSGAALQIAETVIADERGAPLRAQQLILAPDYEGLAPEDRAMRWKFYQEGAI